MVAPSCTRTASNKQQTSHFGGVMVAEAVSRGVGVIFLPDGGKGVWSNVKIITCGGGEFECED